MLSLHVDLGISAWLDLGLTVPKNPPSVQDDVFCHVLKAHHSTGEADDLRAINEVHIGRLCVRNFHVNTGQASISIQQFYHVVTWAQVGLFF